jgi:hypothetical protein
MRQFVAFFATARHLESYLLSLKEAERSGKAGAFGKALSPKANPALIGTGIEAPPLAGLFGMGSCQLLRELYRLGRFSHPAGYCFAFTPLRKVRRLCARLFAIPEGGPSAHTSESIFRDLQVLAKRVGHDPTFNRCFDIPLQFLAEQDHLRESVLDVDFGEEFQEDLVLEVFEALGEVPRSEDAE